MPTDSFLQRPGISPQFLQEAGVEYLTEPEPQLRIPYFDITGKRTAHWRSRLQQVRPTGHKYDQPAGSKSEVYLPHLPLSKGIVLFITEGEFKCMSLMEGGFPAIGLPGLHCYTRDGNDQPQLLPAIRQAIELVRPAELYFVGDSDTVTNLEYYRSAWMLSQCFRQIQLKLIQLALGGPKGIDDLRGQLNGQFPDWLDQARAKAALINPDTSFLVPALLQLEAVVEVIARLPAVERERHIHRVIQMAVLAQLAKEEPFTYVARFCDIAWKASGLTKPAFEKAVADEIRRILGTDGQSPGEDNDGITAQLNSLTPWPEELPLSEIFPAVFGVWKKYLVASEDTLLILALMTIATFFYEETPFRPLLVLTSAEEESGKTTALRLICRLGYRILAATSVSSGSVHRVFDYFDCNLAIDEAKTSLKEEPDLITALNNGFDQESAVIPRWDKETKKFVSFRTNYFKIIAGIGSYLNHDTLSRSFVVTFERATPEEYDKVTDFAFCKVSETQPIARKLLSWANAHREIFHDLVLEMMLRLPKQLRGRTKQKFSVLYALAAFAGKEWYQKLNQAVAHMIRQVSGDVPLHHQLLADICAILEEQQSLRGHSSCKLKLVHHKGEPEREFIETKILISLLLALPEGPWKAYGRTKKLLDANRLFFLLKNYGIRASEKIKIKIQGITYRGLFCDVLLTLFERWNRESKTAPKQPPDDEGGGPDTRFSPESENQPPPRHRSSQAVESEEFNPVAPPTKKHVSATGDATALVIDYEQLTSQVTAVAPDFPAAEKRIELVPPSTAQAVFCIAKHPELFVALDLETFYPWDAETQPKQSDPGQLKRRQKRGLAHPYAKDPRRCAIRFLTIHTKSGIHTHDMYDGPIPGWIRKLLQTHTIIGHNLDFDVNVLRRYGVTISDSIRDTMLAARLLGLGKTKGDQEDLLECEVISEGEELIDEPESDDLLYQPTDNALDAVIHRYLDGIRIPKAIAKLGGSDWSVGEITELQREYIRWDVEHLPTLWERLESELTRAKLLDCFRERMRFFVNLHLIKMTGIPINTVLRDSDREETARLKEAKREEVRAQFAFYRAPVPKSRRKKVKGVKEGADGIPVICAPTIETEDFNPNVPSQVVVALMMQGIEVENARKETLAQIDSPLCRLLLEYAHHKTRLSHIDGIVRSTFHDARVRPAGWNQLAAVTGRITSVQPNLQNIPRNWRRAFEAPSPYFWLTVDLSQIEVYVIALHTKCERMISILAEGKDIYVETIAQIRGLTPVRGSAPDEVSDAYREVGKKLVLGTDYGLTVYGFIRQIKNAIGLEYTLEEAQEFFNRFFEMYPEIKAYHDQAFEDALYAEEVRTISGQRRYLPPLKIDEKDPRTEYWPSREARKKVLLNTPIQGSAADLLISAVNEFLPKLPAGVQPLNLVHDEFNGLATKELLLPAYSVIAQRFDRVFRRFYGDRLQVKVEGYAGKSWADKKKLHAFLSTL